MHMQVHYSLQDLVGAIPYFFPIPPSLLLSSTSFSITSCLNVEGFARNCFLTYLFDRSYLFLFLWAFFASSSQYHLQLMTWGRV
ncbi:hypothetical protein DsansV1_C08g0085741 [Dioscorea sansibarensis]